MSTPPPFLPTLVTPDEARASLARWPHATRRLLAQLVALHLVVEDIPGVSFAPPLAGVSQPLAAEQLAVRLPSEAEQHAYDATWGAVPNGLEAAYLDTRLIGFVCALLADVPVDGELLYMLALARDPRLRVFTPRGGVI